MENGPITRRHILLSGGVALSTALGSPSQHHQDALRLTSPAAPILDPATLRSFVDPLPIPPIAQSLGTRPQPGQTSGRLPYFRIPIQQIELKVHRDLPPTRMWTYARSMPGPTIEVRSGGGILVEWPNGLPQEHLLPVDHTLMGADRGVPNSRTVVHVHGAKAPPESDGYPENWYGPGGAALVHYPNQQPSTLLWYHDHAMGIARLNLYAGMAGLYIIRDDFEDDLGLPRGPYEVPIVLSDRLFTQAGQLFYPRSESPDAPWVPEFFGNVTLVNGTIQPFLNVEPRLYRFRLLNASNSRFYYLSLDSGMPIHQIGSDQGLLAASVLMKNLALGPGERADLLLDFAPHVGKKIVLANGASKLMEFRVASQGSAVPVAALPRALRPVERMGEASAVKTRFLTIEEFSQPVINLLNGARWHDPVTEKPVLDSTEIWCFINLADEPHPIHLHLVRFQVLDRFGFDRWDYQRTRKLRNVGHPVPPSPSEMGWKDTVQCDAKMVTRIIVRFEGYVGRYVWHCHILEHEDNEMMRPFEVLPKPLSS